MECPTCGSPFVSHDDNSSWTCDLCGQQFEATATDANADEPQGWNYDEWAKRGTSLATSQGLSNWDIGEWILEGEPHIPEWDSRDIPHQKRKWWEPPRERTFPSRWDVYSAAEEITGFERNHLRDLASTARRFPRSVRTDALSWTHHRWLINLLPNADEAELKKWLDEAVEKQYVVRQLKAAVRSRNSQGKQPTKEKSFLVTVPLRTYETLHDISRGRNSNVQTVASKFLIGEFDKPEMQEIRKQEKAAADERLYQRRRKVGLKVAEKYDNLGLRKDDPYRFDR